MSPRRGDERARVLATLAFACACLWSTGARAQTWPVPFGPAESGTDAAEDGGSGCPTSGCKEAEHNSIVRGMLGGGARHDAPGVFFAFSADIGIRPLHGALIASISYSMQLGDSAYFWSGGLQLEIDLSHVFASHVFTCLPDRDRRWGFSVGGRMGITGAISHAQLYDGFERVRYGLIRPEWMFFAELRARIWAHWKPGRVFVRAEEHTSLEFTPSRLAVLAGFSFDFDV